MTAKVLEIGSSLHFTSNHPGLTVDNLGTCLAHVKDDIGSLMTSSINGCGTSVRETDTSTCDRPFQALQQ